MGVIFYQLFAGLWSGTFNLRAPAGNQQRHTCPPKRNRKIAVLLCDCLCFRELTLDDRLHECVHSDYRVNTLNGSFNNYTLINNTRVKAYIIGTLSKICLCMIITLSSVYFQSLFYSPNISRCCQKEIESIQIFLNANEAIYQFIFWCVLSAPSMYYRHPSVLTISLDTKRNYIKNSGQKICS